MKAVKAVLLTLTVLAVAVGVVVGAVVIWSGLSKEPLPIEDRCQAVAGGRTTVIDPEQARNAAIIAGMSIKRGLKPRAASIALATAYQESDIRNLDYGHSDSIGLFQQRPSKGWGTVDEIMDPWYSTRAFYRVMERVKNWETKDINDVAQAVQRSAYPEAYRKHVDKARTLASSLTGETPASFGCVIAEPAAANADGMRVFLTKTYGDRITVTTTARGLHVAAPSTRVAWSVAHAAVATTGDFGLVSAQVGTYSWTHTATGVASWVGTPTQATDVELIFTTDTPS